MPPPPPAPTHTIRSHSSPISHVFVSHDNERIYAGDRSGFVSVTSTATLRPVTIWAAHSDSILTVQEWPEAHAVITHGRDNKLHVWDRINTAQSLGDAARETEFPEPTLRYSLDVNALNFCRLSLLPVHGRSTPIGTSSNASSSKHPIDVRHSGALLALPNLVDSSVADIWELPSGKRLHAAIGKAQQSSEDESVPLQESITGGRGANKKHEAGILMSLHVFLEDQLKLLAAYELGSVAFYQFTPSGQHRLVTKVSDYGFEGSIEGRGWECLWKVRVHNESVMAMTVSTDNTFALTVSADHLVVRYNLRCSDPTSIGSKVQPNDSASNTGLWSENEGTTGSTKGGPYYTKFRTKQPGNSSITIRDDGKVCAVGGWDGKVRLYSTKSFKPLGTLSYHTKGCQALAFAHPITTFRGGQEDSASRSRNASAFRHDNVDTDDEELTESEKAARSKWLVCGSQDHRMSIWELITFEQK